MSQPKPYKRIIFFFKPCNTKNRSGPKNSTVKILPWTMTWAITSTCGPEIVANFYTYKSPFPFSLYLVFSWGWCILVWMLAKCNHVLHIMMISQRNLSGIFTLTRYPGYHLFAQASFFLPFSINLSDQFVLVLIPFRWQIHVVSPDDCISMRQWGIRNPIFQPLFFQISRIETNKCRGSLWPISPRNIFQIIWLYKTWKNTFFFLKKGNISKTNLNEYCGPWTSCLRIPSPNQFCLGTLGNILCTIYKMIFEDKYHKYQLVFINSKKTLP